MPAKIKLLPYPCPICGKENGTIQVGILDELRFRIGHYNSQKYQLSKNQYKKNITPKTKGYGTEGKIWHNFRIEFLRMPSDLVDENIFSKKEVEKFDSTITISKNQKFINLIKEKGWRVIPSNSKNKRKNPQNNEIKFNKIIYPIKYEKENIELINVVGNFRYFLEKNKEKLSELVSKFESEDKKLLIDSLNDICDLLSSKNPKDTISGIQLMTSVSMFLGWGYMSKMKVLKISPKHRKRIMNRRVRKLDPVLEPKNKKSALSFEFTGSKCPYCKSFRVEKKEKTTSGYLLYCYACDEYHKN